MKKHPTSNSDKSRAGIERRTSKTDARGAASVLGVGCWLYRPRPRNCSEQPRTTTRTRTRTNQGAFTLIEVLLAVGIFAIVLFAINAVFFSALKLERATTRAVDERLPLNHALAILRRDLHGAVPPLTNSYLLPRDFKAGGRGSFGATASASLEFYTTTGLISDDAAWGDLQKVRYELVEPTDRANARGQELVRIVTRNILATSTEAEEEQLLVSDVASLEFLCYNGTAWRTTWDTTAGDVGLPLAVRVRVHLATENQTVKLSREPLELLVPITTVLLTNSLAGGAQ